MEETREETPQDLRNLALKVAGLLEEAGQHALHDQLNPRNLAQPSTENADRGPRYKLEVDNKIMRFMSARIADIAHFDGFWTTRPAESRPGQRYWYIGKIDGVINYVRRMSEWTVTAALFEFGPDNEPKPIIGIVHAPALGLTYLAARGAGAVRIHKTAVGEKRDKVVPSMTSSLDGSVLSYGMSFIPSESQRALDVASSLAGRPADIKRVGPVSLDLCKVADGTYDAYFEPMLLENNGWSIHVSSVRGKNHFYNEYMDAKADPNSYASHLSAYDVNVFSKDLLDKTRQTYRARYGAVLGDALFSQELESNWEAAVVGAVWAEELVECERDRAFPIKYDPRYSVHTSWDIGSADGTVILYWQIINRVPRLIDWSSIKNRGLATCAEELRSKPYRYGEHVGPHDVMSKTWELDGISRYAEALNYGIKFTPVGKPSRKSDGISASSQLIQIMEVNKSEEPVDDPAKDCAFILDTLKQYRYAFDQERNILSKVPIHDWTSHFADALQTFAIYLATSGADLLNGRMKLKGMEMSEEAYDMTYNNMRLSDILAMQNRKPRALGGWNSR